MGAQQEETTVGDYAIAGRYAGALSGAVPDAAAAEEALSALTEFADLIAGHHDLRSCLSNPSIPREARGRVLIDVMGRLGVSGPVANLVREMTDRGRVGLIPAAAKAFSDIVDERMNRVSAKVTSALPLTDEQRQIVADSLAAYSGKAVRMKCEVDAELIGGVVAHIGGQIIDGTVRSQLEDLKRTLSEQDA